MMHVAAFVDEQHGRYISAVHEAGALAMADGYSRFSGRPGIASVTHGPGVTNTMTALTEAVRARSAVLLLTGDPPPVRNYSQRIDLQAAANLAGAGYWRVLTAEHTVDDIAMILDRIQSERRPTLMDISATIQAADIEYRSPRRRSIVARPECVPDEVGLDEALGVIASSNRIVVLAGRGATSPDARAELAALADQLAAVLATTLLAKDLFRDHPYNIGLVGTTAADLSFDVIARADCIVAFGSGLGRHTTSVGQLFGGKAVIHVDTDPDVIGRELPAVAVIGDAAHTARRMREHLTRAEYRPGTGLRTDVLREAIAASMQFDPARDISGNGTVDIRAVASRLDELLPATRVVVSDAGRFKRAPWNYLRLSDPPRFTHTASFGSIGLSVSTSIGAALAAPDAVTICLTGDGAAMMSLIEVSTAARHRIPVVILVFDDGSYGVEYTKLAEYGADPRNSLMAWPDFDDVARSLGGVGLSVRTLADLDAVPQLIADLRGPLVIDIHADPAQDVVSDW